MFNSMEESLVFWDKARRSISIAMRSLWLQRLRSFLSLLGITIGTVAVITLMAFGEGSMQDAMNDIARQGATNIIISSVKPVDGSLTLRTTKIATYGLTYADYEHFLLLDTVARSVPIRIFPQEIRRAQRVHKGRVVGTTAAYQQGSKLELAVGRFLMDADEIEAPSDGNEMRNVAVLGSDVAEALFPFESAVGKTIVLSTSPYVVVGIVKERTPMSGSGGASEDFNSDVYIPLKTFRGRYGESVFVRQSGSRTGEQVELHQITLTISEMSKVRDAGAFVRDVLERRHLSKDWTVTIPLDRLEAAERARDRYRILLFFIASISLFVGGVGIMNIMLATVSERTQEIGIRRALGAKRQDITMQFLTEAMVQTTVGGILGTVIGVSLVYALPWFVGLVLNLSLPAALQIQSIFWSMGVAVVVGVLFGWYPAYRASRLDPIEALRHH